MNVRISEARQHNGATQVQPLRRHPDATPHLFNRPDRLDAIATHGEAFHLRTLGAQRSDHVGAHGQNAIAIHAGVVEKVL